MIEFEQNSTWLYLRSKGFTRFKLIKDLFKIKEFTNVKFIF